MNCFLEGVLQVLLAFGGIAVYFGFWIGLGVIIDHYMDRKYDKDTNWAVILFGVGVLVMFLALGGLVNCGVI